MYVMIEFSVMQVDKKMEKLTKRLDEHLKEVDRCLIRRVGKSLIR